MIFDLIFKFKKGKKGLANGVKIEQSEKGANKIMAGYLYCYVQATGVKMVLSGEGV